MHVVGIASRNGGSGETTLSAHLAVAAEAAGAGPVAVMDTDPQGGLAGWWNARAAEAPRWIDPTHGLPAAVTAARTTGYGLLLIDTPPSALVQIDCMGKRIPDAASRLQAPSTAFSKQQARFGLEHPDGPVRMALDFLPMVKKEMAEGPVPPRTAPFCVGNDKSFGRWRGKSLASVPPE